MTRGPLTNLNHAAQHDVVPLKENEHPNVAVVRDDVQSVMARALDELSSQLAIAHAEKLEVKKNPPWTGCQGCSRFGVRTGLFSSLLGPTLTKDSSSKKLRHYGPPAG